MTRFHSRCRPQNRHYRREHFADILHEDDQLIVLNKLPVWCASVPGNRGAPRSSPIAATRYPALRKRPGIVHRLTRTQAALWRRLKPMPRICRSASTSTAATDVQRSYQALVGGTPFPASAKLTQAYPREHNCRKMAVSPMKARHAVTHYQVQESFLDGQVTRLACHLETAVRTKFVCIWYISATPCWATHFMAGMKVVVSLDETATAALEALAQALHAAAWNIRPPVRAWILSCR